MTLVALLCSAGTGLYSWWSYVHGHRVDCWRDDFLLIAVNESGTTVEIRLDRRTAKKWFASQARMDRAQCQRFWKQSPPEEPVNGSIPCPRTVLALPDDRRRHQIAFSPAFRSGLGAIQNVRTVQHARHVRPLRFGIRVATSLNGVYRAKSPGLAVVVAWSYTTSRCCPFGYRTEREVCALIGFSE